MGNINLDKEINDTSEYLKYAIEQIFEKNYFYYHSKVYFTNSNYFKKGDKLLIENKLCKLGVGFKTKECKLKSKLI